MLGPMTDVPYTHGHHDSVLRSHRWRTAENSAAYLLPHLRARAGPARRGVRSGDHHRGPGRPGGPRHRVVGVDAAAEVIAEATGPAVDPESTPNVSFRGGRRLRPAASTTGRSTWSTPTRCSSTWATRWPPCPRCAGCAGRAGWWPPGTGTTRPSPGTSRPTRCSTPPRPPTGRLARANGGHTDAGRRLLAWAHRAGFATVVPSASVWCFATPEERRWWGGLWADRFTVSSLAEQLVARGLATDGRSRVRSRAAWRRWAADPDGWFAVLHGEVLCTP